MVVYRKILSWKKLKDKKIPEEKNIERHDDAANNLRSCQSWYGVFK
jgi:hypothetical protein